MITKTSILIFITLLIFSVVHLLYYWWFGSKLNWHWLNKSKIKDVKFRAVFQANRLVRLNFAFLSFALVIYSIICSVYASTISDYNEEYSITNPFKIAEFGLLQIKINDEDNPYIYDNASPATPNGFIIIVDNSAYHKDIRSNHPLLRGLLDKEFSQDTTIKPSKYLNFNSAILITILEILKSYKNTNSVFSIGVYYGDNRYNEPRFKWLNDAYIEDSRISELQIYDIQKKLLNGYLQLLDNNSYKYNRNNNTNFNSIIDKIRHPLIYRNQNKYKLGITLVSGFTSNSPWNATNISSKIFNNNINQINLLNLSSKNKRDTFIIIDNLKNTLASQDILFQEFNEDVFMLNKNNKHYNNSLKDVCLDLISPIEKKDDIINLYFDEIKDEYRLKLRINDELKKDSKFTIKLISSSTNKIKNIKAKLNFESFENESNKPLILNNKTLEIKDIHFPKFSDITLSIKSFSSEDLKNLKLEIYSSSKLSKSHINLEFKKKLPKNISEILYFIGCFISTELIYIIILILIWITLHYILRNVSPKSINQKVNNSISLHKLTDIKGIGSFRAGILKEVTNIKSIEEFINLTNEEILVVLNSNSKSKLSIKQIEEMKNDSIKLLKNAENNV